MLSKNRGGYQNNQTFSTERTAIEFIKCDTCNYVYDYLMTLSVWLTKGKHMGENEINK